MEWNCTQCSSRCLREMEDSVCVCVKDFSRMPFPKESVKAYLKKNRYGRATFLPLTSINGSQPFSRPEALKENGIRYDLEWEQGSITLPEEFLEGTGEKISGDGNGASGFYLESGPGGDISVLAEPV